MKNNPVEEKSFAFAVRIVNLYKYLTDNKREFVLAKQLLRSGTSIGANVSEAERGQTKADFIAKLSVALKEANETDYWLRLLHATGYLTKAEYDSMNGEIRELIALLTTICKSATSNLKNAK